MYLSQTKEHDVLFETDRPFRYFDNRLTDEILWSLLLFFFLQMEKSVFK